MNEVTDLSDPECAAPHPLVPGPHADGATYGWTVLGSALLLAAWVTDARDASDAAAMSGTAILLATWTRFCFFEWLRTRSLIGPHRIGSVATTPRRDSPGQVPQPSARRATVLIGRTDTLRPPSGAARCPKDRSSPPAAPALPDACDDTDTLNDTILEVNCGIRRVIDDLHRTGATLGSQPIVESSRQLDAVHRHLEELLQCGV
jgi:hypothetical protein